MTVERAHAPTHAGGQQKEQGAAARTDRLDRGSPRPPASSGLRAANEHVLGLQRLAGNAAVARLVSPAPDDVLYRQPDPPDPGPLRTPGARKKRHDLEGLVVLHGKSGHEPVTVTTTREIAPPWEDAAGFAGFRDEMPAVVAATRRAMATRRVSVVLLYRGAFRAVETDAMSLKHVTFASPSALAVRFLEPPREAKGDNWAERVKKATEAADASTATSAYIALLVEATGYRRDEVHACSGGTATGGSPPDAKPGFLNFSLSKADTAATTYPASLRAERSGPLTAPVVVIGPHALLGGSPEFVRSSVVHELKHAGHLSEVIALIEKWRQSRSRLPFERWLARSRGVPDEIRWVAQTVVVHRVQGGTTTTTTHVTELFANLESLNTELHHLPQKDLTTTSAAWGPLIVRLVKITGYYLGAEIEPPKREFFDRLDRASSKLDRDRCEAFARLVGQLPTALAVDRNLADRRADWEPFVKKLAGIGERCRNAPREP
jgi:hypothetical protein